MQHSENTSTDLITTAVQRVLDTGGIAALVTLIEGDANVGAKLLLISSREVVGGLGDTSLDKAVAVSAVKFLESREEARSFRIGNSAAVADSDKALVLMERIQPEPRIVICGAGHVGASLARLAILAGYRAALIDDRPEFVKRELFPDPLIELVPATSWSDATIAAIGNGAGVSVAVVTRGHQEDEECLRAIMTTQPAYVGLIGSKRRTNIVLDRLREGGVSEEKLLQVRAPIGLDIGAVTPEEVALAIFAEIVATRRGGNGGSLSAWRREGMRSAE